MSNLYATKSTHEGMEDYSKDFSTWNSVPSNM